jgi:acyl-CoA dehydrogenase
MTDHYNEELLGLLDRIKEFLRVQVYPLEQDFLRSPFRELTSALAAKREQVKSMGLWAPHLPKEHGGLGLTLSEFALVSEELGRTPIGHYLFNCQAPDIGNMEILMEHGTADQQERYFAPLARGELRSCFSMTEPEHPGSNPTWMSTTAVKTATTTSSMVTNGSRRLPKAPASRL